MFSLLMKLTVGIFPKIFGELITLIEDSKRDGGDEAMSVILP